jgi:hypothetical protein
MSNEINHYLVTLELLSPVRMHGYVMATDVKYARAVANQMCEIAEANELQPLGIILLTTLSNGSTTDIDGVALVRRIVCANSLDARQAIEAATDYHCSIFTMAKDHPDDRPLMELH